MKNNNDFVELFEQRLCEYTNAPYAVVVDRCTNAILLCLEYMRLWTNQISKANTLSIPARTYISVPMTLINYGYDVILTDDSWAGHYPIGNTAIYDYAVGFNKQMYEPGQFQCLSFQQKKRLPIGKGGAILTDDAKAAEILKRMRHDGRDSSIHVSRDTGIIQGYHMYMSPDEAARGILLINQPMEIYRPGISDNYPDARKLAPLRDYIQ